MSEFDASKEINSLPDPLRSYIHEIETNCDPAGTVRENLMLRDTVSALEIRLSESELEVAKVQARADWLTERLAAMSDAASRYLDATPRNLSERGGILAKLLRSEGR